MRFPLAFSLLLIAGCASAPSGPPPVAPPSGPRAGLFISPMGEPFRARETPGADLIARWFAGADLDGDGNLTVAEMQRDADRFFRTLDVNGDGEITPPEMVRYEEQVAPEIQLGSQAGRGGMGMGRGGFAGRRGNAGGHRGPPPGETEEGGEQAAQPGKQPAFRLPEGASRYALLDMPQPVAAADADFNRAVTRAEFEAAAAERFQLLDKNHDGRLTRAELQPAPVSTPQKSAHRHGGGRQRPQAG